MFDFLREVVSKVPDYGHAQGQGHGQGDVTMEDRSISKRRLDILPPSILVIYLISLCQADAKWLIKSGSPLMTK